MASLDSRTIAVMQRQSIPSRTLVDAKLRPARMCRGCGAPLNLAQPLCDLGALPLANALLSEHQLDEPEVHYPLRPLACADCGLVQLPDLPRESIFDDGYPFFAGNSLTWHGHCKRFADLAQKRFGLGATSRVLEIGSNDGTMLRRFRGLGIPAVGVEPCASVAQHALMEGLPTIVDFWGVQTAERLLATSGSPTGQSWRADLVVATNVLAHVPDLGDFLDGVRRILSPGGSAVFEVAYLGDTVEGVQFDQIYAEHYSYFTLRSISTALARSGLLVFDAEHPEVHGGSLRVWAKRDDCERSRGQEPHGNFRPSDEAQYPLEADDFRAFARRVGKAKAYALAQLAARRGKRIVGYGAPAKATTFLNYCGIRSDQISCIGDVTTAKQGKFVPGVRIPIVAPEQMAAWDPDFVVLLAWNWAEEAVPKIRKLCPSAQVIMLREDPR